MSSYVSLEIFKKHVYADDIGDVDDAVLSLYLDAAEAIVLQRTNRTAADLLEEGGGVLPPPLIHAIMLLGGHYYANREAVGSNTAALPYGVDFLVKPYKRLV